MRTHLLNVTDHQQQVHALVSREVARSMFAALAADPATLAELLAAAGRYWDLGERPVVPPEVWQPGLLDPSLPDRSAEGCSDCPVLTIDLTARVVASEHCGSWLSRTGRIPWHGIDQGTTPDSWEVPYALAGDWLLIEPVRGWQQAARRRREKRACSPPDVRVVLYGKLAGALVPEVMAARQSRIEAIRDIHARWLMTPRADLSESDGTPRSPRQVLVGWREHIDRDIEHQAYRWSMSGTRPPAVVRESTTPAGNGFGTHEIVMYYDLVRYLLHRCWDHVKPADWPAAEPLAAPADRDPQRPARRARLLVDPREAIDRLAKLQQEWLHTPQHDDLGGRTPAQIIALERARLPLAITRDDALERCQCAICRALAATPTSPGDPPASYQPPLFVSFDLWHADDDFAFSLTEESPTDETLAEGTLSEELKGTEGTGRFLTEARRHGDKRGEFDV